MSAKLIDKLPLPEKRDEMIQACCGLLDSEVKKKKGFSGMAIKAGYKTLQAFKPGAAGVIVNAMFDDMLAALEPFHDDFSADSGPGTFGSYIQERAVTVAPALVAVTDRRAENSKHKSLKSFYKKLRPTAIRNVEEAMPGLGQVIDRFYS